MQPTLGKVFAEGDLSLQPGRGLLIAGSKVPGSGGRGLGQGAGGRGGAGRGEAGGGDCPGGRLTWTPRPFPAPWEPSWSHTDSPGLVHHLRILL